MTNIVLSSVDNILCSQVCQAFTFDYADRV